MEIVFKHRQTAHCENGVASNLLKYNGLEISEPMVFGLGSGLFFIYIPLLKVNHAPAISYRPMPGYIFNRMANNLGIKIKRQKFKDPKEAQQILDENLKNNIPTGLQVGVYNLVYFPNEYRFHFNAHNLIVYGKDENKNYLISDPVMEHPTTLTEKELEKVRFAKGTLAPKGHLYYPIYIPQEIDLKKAIRKAIHKTCSDMLAPVPIVGANGIIHVSKKIRHWAKTVEHRKLNHYLAQMIRMQEEIGTGGAGFRFIYAAFLQEASVILENPTLMELSKDLTRIGDLWRNFAVDASRFFKKRNAETSTYDTVADQLLCIGKEEKVFFKKLQKAIKE